MSGRKKEWVIINSYMVFAFQKHHTIVNLQRHSVHRKQFHITGSFTQCLGGENFEGWPNTNVSLGLTWKLCFRPALVGALVQLPALHLKNLPCLS